MRFFRIYLFHLKQYVSNHYFFWLTITSTVSIFFLQYIVAYANHDLTDSQIWIKSGVFGLWSSTTTAAGSIGFQRFQGTLPYLLNTQYDERGSLIALLLPASSYGLTSFPISFVMAKILSVSVGSISLSLVISVLFLWAGAALMGILIASFFTLTPNALVYEELINLPIILLSGLFGSEKILSPLTNVTQWVIPITAPVARLTGRSSSLSWLAFLTSFGIWIVIILLVVRRINDLSKEKGTLKVI